MKNQSAARTLLARVPARTAHRLKDILQTIIMEVTAIIMLACISPRMLVATRPVVGLQRVRAGRHPKLPKIQADIARELTAVSTCLQLKDTVKMRIARFSWLTRATALNQPCATAKKTSKRVVAATWDINRTPTI